MKKRMLICHWNMVIGGIETALINMLKRIDPNQFEVDLLLEEKRGDFLEFIPAYVNVFDSASIGLLHGSTKKALLHELKRFRFISAAKVLYYWEKRDLRRFDCFYRKAKHMQYDIAISYSMHSLGLLRFVNDYVEAPIKLVFLHGEPTRDKTDSCKFLMLDREKCLYNYDGIFGVSNGITEKFTSLYPQYADKCQTIYNFMDVERYYERADEFHCVEMTPENVNILSVGRFAQEKNFLIIPYVCEELNRKGINYKWFIIGDGSEREQAQAEIAKRGLQNRLYLLGAKKNPYPYYKACDLYCQTSKSEAYCTTVNEARIFNKPIVSTMFPGITEQLADGQWGIIVEITPRAIAEGIIKIIEMSELDKQNMLKKSAYPNALEENAGNKFFEIIGQKTN